MLKRLRYWTERRRFGQRASVATALKQLGATVRKIFQRNVPGQAER